MKADLERELGQLVLDCSKCGAPEEARPIVADLIRGFRGRRINSPPPTLKAGAGAGTEPATGYRESASRKFVSCRLLASRGNINHALRDGGHEHIGFLLPDRAG